MKEKLVAMKKNLIYSTRNILGSYSILFPLLRFHPRYKHLMMTAQSEICIEGFPRSANSFAVAAFRHYNPNLNIARHVHVPMQVVKALEKGVPCLVLIRQPIDALSSLMIVDLNLSISIAIRSYINFYQRIYALIDKFVLADFEEIITDYQSVIARLNSFYGTSFVMEPIDDKTQSVIFSQLESHHKSSKLSKYKYLVPVPTHEKKILKQKIIEKIRVNPYYDEAVNIYQLYMSHQDSTIMES
jgi:hypothetical protein